MATCPQCQQACADGATSCPACGQALADRANQTVVLSGPAFTVDDTHPDCGPNAASPSPTVPDVAPPLPPRSAQTVESEFIGSGTVQLDDGGALFQQATVDDPALFGASAAPTPPAEKPRSAMTVEAGPFPSSATVQLDEAGPFASPLGPADLSGISQPSAVLHSGMTIQAGRWAPSADDLRDAASSAVNPSAPSQPILQTVDSQSITPSGMHALAAAWGSGGASGSASGSGASPSSAKTARPDSAVSLSESLVIQPRVLRSDSTAPSPTAARADYSLMKKLGEGGMGVVYAARQSSINRTVALKMLKSQGAQSGPQREKFLAEAVVTGDLEHPNIVPIYDLGHDETGAIFYAMKHVKGTPWDKLVGTKSVPENLEVLMKVADAVAFAHSKGVLHRDLKPENVMLGDFGEVLVMDWGLAMPLKGPRGPVSMGGTPAYMAPEMATGPIQHITPASDVYLLGAILYEIVTRRRPHEGSTISRCLMAAAKNDIVPTEEKGELVDIARRAMATDPKDRYVGVREFQDAIRRYQSHTESIALSTRAEQDLVEAQKSRRYETYARSLFAFQEAVALWDGNEPARSGVSTAAVAYATAALDKGDFDLGLSLLNPKDERHVELASKLRAAQDERESRRRRLAAARRIGIGLVAAILFIVTGAFLWIRAEADRARKAEVVAVEKRREAEEQRQEAERQRLEADEQRKVAVQQRERAEAAHRETEIQRAEAVKQKTVAEEQRAAAVAAQKVAEEQRAAALAAKLEEEKQRKVAEDQRAAALLAKMEEEKQRVAAVAAQKVAEEQRAVALAAQKTAEEQRAAAVAAKLQEEKQRLAAVAAQKVAEEQRAAALLAKMEEEKQRKVADEQRIAAVAAQKTAEEQRAAAVAAKLQEEKQRLAAVAAQKIAEEQRAAALLAKMEEEKQRKVADEQRATAVAAQKVAEEQRAAALAAKMEEEKQRKTAEEQRAAAITAKLQEEKQRLAAVAAQKVAEEQRAAALTAKMEEEKQRKVAEDQRAKAVVAQKEAEAARNEEEKQRKVAEQQRAAAVAAKLEEEKQRKLAEAAKEKEEYEGYVARIGLAAAKIEENAFDQAATLLEDCPPRLRNWEWGRLAYLCSRTEKSIDCGLPLEALAASPDGRRIAVAGWSGQVQIVDLESGRKLRTIDTRAEYVFSLAFSPDGRHVAVGTNAKPDYVTIWDVESGQLVRGLRGHRDAVLSVVYSRRGDRLLTGSYDNTAKLWNLASSSAKSGAEKMDAEKTFAGHDWWVWSATFSPDERRIVTTSQDGSALVWSVDSGTAGPPFLAHGAPVYSAAFSPDGQQVATAGYDKRVLLWRPEDLRGTDLAKLLADDAPAASAPVPFVAFDGHTAAVRSVRFSDDGRLLLTGGHDNAVSVWDVATRELVKSLRGHSSRVSAALFLPGGERVVSAGHDQRARLWNVAKYEEVRVLGGRVLKGHRDAILGAAFAPDGRTVVTASRDRSAIAWDVATSRRLRAYDEGHAYLASTALFYPDGKRVLTAAADNTARLWDVAAGTQHALLEGTGPNAAVALAPDGRWIVSGSDDKSAKVWDGQTGKLVRRIAGFTSDVTAVAFAPDGRTFLTGDSVGRCKLVQLDTGTTVWESRSHSRPITAIAFAGPRILTASLDHSVGQWDAATGREDTSRVLKHPESVTALALSPDGKQALTACGDKKVRLWDVDRAQVLRTLDAGDVVTTEVAFAPNGRRALTTTADNRLHLWDIATGKELTNGAAIPVQAKGTDAAAFLDLSATTLLVWSAAFSASGDRLLTVGGAEAHLWDASNAKLVMTFSPQSAVSSVQFSRDGRQIVTGSWDNAARVWNTATGAALTKLSGVHSRFVNASVFSPDGRHVLTASDDKTVRLWNATDGKLVRTFAGHEGRVTDVTFSSDGQFVLTAGDDKTARLWDASTAKPLHVLRGHDQAVLCAKFSADDKRIITGSEDTTARLWDAATGAPLAVVLAGHTSSVTSVAFTPDGRRAVTGSKDITTKVWDAETGKEVLTLTGHSQEITTVTLSADGRHLLTGSRDGTAIVWLTNEWGK